MMCLTRKIFNGLGGAQPFDLLEVNASRKTWWRSSSFGYTSCFQIIFFNGYCSLRQCHEQMAKIH
jgi:hypothetical protein